MGDDRNGIQSGDRRAKAVAWGAVGLLVLLFVAGLAMLARAPDNAARLFTGDMTPEQLGAQLRAIPELRGFYEEFERLYPAEHRRYLQRLSTTYNSRGRAAADREAFQFMRNFMVSKADAMINAPDAELVRLGRANYELVRTLRDTDVALCALYATRGFGEGVRPPPAAIERLGELSRLQIRAAHAGETAKRPPRPPLSDADYAKWLAAMEALDPVLARMISDGSIERAPPERQCAAGIILYRTAAELPEALAASVNAHLFRASLQATPR